MLINDHVSVGLKGLLAASNERVVTVDRVATSMIMALAMSWSTQGGQFGTIFEAVSKIPMTFAPTATTVFMLGVIWKRDTKQARGTKKMLMRSNEHRDCWDLKVF